MSSYTKPYSNSNSSVVPYRSPPGTARDLAAGVRKGEILDDEDEDDIPRGEITLDSIAEWSRLVEKNQSYLLAQTVLSRSSLKDILIPRAVEIADSLVFNLQIPDEGSLITNQQKSGRCWLFATTNVLRKYVSRKYKLEDFQLSQAYVFFYDHLAKANWFLDQMIKLAEEPLDSRTVQFLLAGTEAQDGGQYDMACALIDRYGLVPQCVYPESFNSSNSEELDNVLSSQLRKFAVDLREEYTRTISQASVKRAVRSAEALKEQQLAVIYRILAISLGTPPHPNEKFVWEFRNKDKKFTKIVTTPKDFVRDCVSDYDPQNAISLINDPRNPYRKLYTVERLGNVVGGRPIRYVNADIDILKKAAIDALKQNQPVWFGCDVVKAASFKEGLLDESLDQLSNVFGTSFDISKETRMSKEKRLRTGDTQMTHAMIFTGVHLEEKKNPDDKDKAIRWKVENSWGTERIRNGMFLMTDDWFTENVFQVAIQRNLVPKDLRLLYESSEKPIKLAPWDPFGSLA